MQNTRYIHFDILESDIGIMDWMIPPKYPSLHRQIVIELTDTNIKSQNAMNENYK